MRNLLLTTTALITLVAAVAEAAPKKAKKAPKAEMATAEHMHTHSTGFKMDLHGRQEFNVASRSVKKEYMQVGGGSSLNTGGYLTKKSKKLCF